MKINDVFSSDGLLAKKFPDTYEFRAGQLRMSQMVDKAIDQGFSAIIEGSTGVGKSLAYLAPIVLSGCQAIVSTSNKSLQDQLSTKDLPLLKEVIPNEVTWAVLKGKNNYFCHEHFIVNQRQIEDAVGEVEVKKLLAWVEETKDGDIEHYPGKLPPKVRNWVTCDSRTTHEKDSPYRALCFARHARTRAKTARVILTNHSLLALDLSIRRMTEGKVGILPKTNVVIIDEAHAFEESAILAFSDEISIFSLFHYLNWFIVKQFVPQPQRNRISNAFRQALRVYLPKKDDRGYYPQQRSEKFSGFGGVIAGIKQINATVMVELAKQEQTLDELTRIKMKEVQKEGKNLIERLEKFDEEDSNTLRWSEARDDAKGNPIVKLKSVPLDISNLLKEQLFTEKSVICTSATLSVNNSFGFFRGQVGVPKTALELIVNSPFDFKSNALIYITKGENEKWWEIQELLKYSKGRAFVLFTSYKDMRDCFGKVEIPYPKFIQKFGESRSQLLEDFKKTEHAVLFATKSFWEGVDVSGEQLMLVIIHKLPFANPRDLIYASKIERIEKRLGKGKHWMTYTIPFACLKLKQGVGRLIRTKSDKGVIALLDARINYKSYRNSVIGSLPPAYRTQKLDNVKNFYGKVYYGE